MLTSSSFSLPSQDSAAEAEPQVELSINAVMFNSCGRPMRYFTIHCKSDEVQKAPPRK